MGHFKQPFPYYTSHGKAYTIVSHNSYDIQLFASGERGVFVQMGSNDPRESKMQKLDEDAGKGSYVDLIMSPRAL